MQTKEKIKELSNLVEDIENIANLLEWDQEIIVHPENKTNRGRQIEAVCVLKSLVLKMHHKLIVSALNETKNTKEHKLVETLYEKFKEVDAYSNEDEKRFHKLIDESLFRWRNATNTGIFSPWEETFSQLVEVLKERARKGKTSAQSIYEFYVNQNEKIDLKTVNNVCNEIKAFAKENLKLNDKNLKLKKLSARFNDQWDLVNVLISQLNSDVDKISKNISSTPFTISCGKNDIRMVVSIDEKNVFETLSTTMHEYGHWFYEHELHKSLGSSLLAGQATNAMHETLAHFFEYEVGRSFEFASFSLDIFQNCFKFKEESRNNFFKTLNIKKHKRSYIFEELNYALNMILRHEIEQELLDGDLKVKDVAKVWRKKYRDVFGYFPENGYAPYYDIHWAEGSFGYFVTYIIGMVCSGQLANHLWKNERDKMTCISHGDFKPLHGWLRKHIFKNAKAKCADTMIMGAINKHVDVNEFISYFSKKMNSLRKT